VARLAKTRWLSPKSFSRYSVAAKALRRDGPQGDEECQYHELFDHGAIVASCESLEADPV
jgi:hypothetical protein